MDPIFNAVHLSPWPPVWRRCSGLTRQYFRIHPIFEAMIESWCIHARANFWCVACTAMHMACVELAAAGCSSTPGAACRACLCEGGVPPSRPPLGGGLAWLLAASEGAQLPPRLAFTPLMLRPPASRLTGWPLCVLTGVTTRAASSASRLHGLPQCAGRAWSAWGRAARVRRVRRPPPAPSPDRARPRMYMKK